MAKEPDLSKSMDAAAGAKKKPALTPPPRRPGIGNVAASISPHSHTMPRAVEQAAVVMDDFPYDTALRLALVGAGQGGSRIANSFWELGYRRVAAFNTTEQDFDGLAAEIPKHSLDIGGARKDMQFARDALRGREEEVRDLFLRAWGSKFDCVLVCAGLGGGSGGGTALPLVKLAREYMEQRNLPVRVGVIVSLPSADEGQQVARNAVTAFNELLAEKVSPIIVIDNDRVHELYRPPMSQLLSHSNKLISELLHLFNQLAAARSPYITFDRSEFTQLLDGGLVVMGSADIPVDQIKSPADVSTRIREDLAESVLASVDLKTGKKAACIFVGSQEVLDTFSKDYFAAGFTQLNRLLNGNSDEPDPENPTVVHRGLYPGEADGLQCYTIVSELEPPVHKLQALAKAAGLPRGTASTVARHLNVD